MNARRIQPVVVSLAVLVFGLGVGAIAASAASLGGIIPHGPFVEENSYSIPDPEPTPIVSTDFSTCSNFIDGWVDELGNTWTSHSGNWQCLGSGVVRAQQREAMANLTVGIAETTDLFVSTEISDISHQNNRSGPGLSLLADGSGHYLYILYERDNDQLVIGVTGGDSTTYPIAGDFESATLSATITGGQFTVTFASESLAPISIPAGFDIPWFGLVSDNDNQSRFTSFLIEDLS